PSLQAAFIDYGGNRHGFLAFSEIHPDYYQIPVADRQALIAEDERAQRAAEPPAEFADATEEVTAETPSAVAVAAEPMPLEPSEEAPAAAEPPIELAQLEAAS